MVVASPGGKPTTKEGLHYPRPRMIGFTDCKQCIDQRHHTDQFAQLDDQPGPL